MKEEIIQGDCLIEMQKIPDKSIDVVFTSPPYNRKRNDKYEHYDDTLDDYFGFLCEAIDHSMRICKKYCIFNIQKNYYNKEDVYRIFGKYSDKIQEVFVWEKTNPMPAAGLSITNSFEYFIFFGNKPVKSNRTYTKNIISSSVHSSMGKNHKAVMKPEISDYFINTFSEIGEVILDPFAGTGTTGISCKKLGRNFILIEKEPEYIEVIKKRLSYQNTSDTI
jgi:DNA modification methylase